MLCFGEPVLQVYFNVQFNAVDNAHATTHNKIGNM